MSRSVFDKVLIANRGEIACRIIKTCRRLGISTVAIHTSAEGSPLHAELADESYVLPESATPAGSYLDAKAIVDIAAKDRGKCAIHPGYGFLSESPALAERCAERGIACCGASLRRGTPDGRQVAGSQEDGIAGRSRAAGR